MFFAYIPALFRLKAWKTDDLICRVILSCGNQRRSLREDIVGGRAVLKEAGPLYARADIKKSESLGGKTKSLETKSKSLETKSKSLENDGSRLLDFFSSELVYFSTELKLFSRGLD